MKRYLVKISGDLQGVGLKFFAQGIASSNNLTGRIKNCDDGTIHMEVQGEDRSIVKFLSTIRKDNQYIKIEDMVTKNINLVDNEKAFKIKN